MPKMIIGFFILILIACGIIAEVIDNLRHSANPQCIIATK